MVALNVREVLARVRSRIHDRGSTAFDDAEILEVLDDELRELFTLLRVHGEAQELDYLDLTVATALTKPELRVYQFYPSEIVGEVVHLEALQGANSVPPIPIHKASLEEKDIGYGTLNISNIRVWHFGPGGSVQIRGSMESYATLRVWFTRAIPAMCYGNASAGSTTSLTASTVTGGYKNRADLLVNSRIEITADSGQPTNVGAVRRVTSFASGVLGFDALPAAASSTTQWAMLLPLAPEYATYLMKRVCRTLFGRFGSGEEIALMQDELNHAELAFESGISRKSSGEPPRLSSSRTRM